MTASLSPSPSDLTFGVAETLGQLKAVRRFRKRTYRTRSGLHIDDPIAIDRRSFVFALHREQQPVATLRLLPLPDSAAGIYDFAGSVVDPTFGADMELGRLAVEAGESPAILLSLIGLAAHWLCENSELTNYVAYCNPKLRFGYEMFGAVDRDVDVRHPMTNRRYRLLTGLFVDALPASGPLAA